MKEIHRLFHSSTLRCISQLRITASKMKSVLAILIALSNVLAISAFTVQPQVPAANLNVPAALTQISSAQTVSQIQQPTSFNSYLDLSESSLNSASNVVALQDRKPPPTAEEIAAKKRNFNLWFWGGGFVAPFLATFYYFGLKFWEK